MAVELYLFPHAGMAQGETSHRVDAELEVDGWPAVSINDRTVAMETAGDAAQRIRFAFTGIGTNGAVFDYDTTEVPAGMVINPPAEVLAQVD